MIVSLHKPYSNSIQTLVHYHLLENIGERDAPSVRQGLTLEQVLEEGVRTVDGHRALGVVKVIQDFEGVTHSH